MYEDAAARCAYAIATYGDRAFVCFYRKRGETPFGKGCPPGKVEMSIPSGEIVSYGAGGLLAWVRARA